MAAAAYKVMAVFAYGNPNGQKKIIPLTASDVNAAFWLFPSGANELPISGGSDTYLIDTILSAAGTDTSQVEIFLNGSSTGIKLLNATSLGTIIGRPFQQAPLRIPQGASIKFTQLT